MRIFCRLAGAIDAASIRQLLADSAGLRVPSSLIPLAGAGHRYWVAWPLRMQEKPDFRMVDIVHDAGPGKMLWLLDKLLKEEATAKPAVVTA